MPGVEGGAGEDSGSQAWALATLPPPPPTTFLVPEKRK